LNETLNHLGSGRGAGAHLKTTIPPVAD
jgi:hypothetical protein